MKIRERDGDNLEKRNARILELHRCGLSNGVIAQRFGINKMTVGTIIRKAKIDERRAAGTHT